MNDKGDSKTIQQIVKAVVANLNFIKGEALRLLRTNFSQFSFEENIKKILPFVTQYHPALPNLKDTLMGSYT